MGDSRGINYKKARKFRAETHVVKGNFEGIIYSISRLGPLGRPL
jgi:hypothetical protein